MHKNTHRQPAPGTRNASDSYTYESMFSLIQHRNANGKSSPSPLFTCQTGSDPELPSCCVGGAESRSHICYWPNSCHLKCLNAHACSKLQGASHHGHIGQTQSSDIGTQSNCLYLLKIKIMKSKEMRRKYSSRPGVGLVGWEVCVRGGFKDVIGTCGKMVIGTAH